MKKATALGSKMLLTYNIVPERQEIYMRFMLNEFISTLQSLGLENVGVWHTAYGNYPLRLLVFVTKDSDAMARAIASDLWEEMEEKLKTFVTDYTRRIVPLDQGFQF